MNVLGVSGSPVRDSNTDRALKLALKSTGLETEFIKLIDYRVEPCRACLGCVRTNRCVVDDDGIALAEKVKKADALIVGGFTPYSSLDSRTKAFLERMYPLRHKRAFMAGKPGGAIITSAVPAGSEMLPPAADFGINAIQFYMMEEEMDFVGEVRVMGNVPCIKCGMGNECKTSGIKMLYGPDATVESVGCSAFENQPEAVEAAIRLGKAIAARLESK